MNSGVPPRPIELKSSREVGANGREAGKFKTPQVILMGFQWMSPAVDEPLVSGVLGLLFAHLGLSLGCLNGQLQFPNLQKGRNHLYLGRLLCRINEMT